VQTKQIESLLTARANDYLRQSHLIVDYYRIRRKVAYALPVRDLAVPTFPVHDQWTTGERAYPWATWMTWNLEQRIIALGTTAQWFGDEQYREAAARDLVALAHWPRYHQYDRAELSYAHAVRIMVHALRAWDWMDDALRGALVDGCARAVEQVRGWFDAQRDPMIHNIPVIGTMMLAAAARLVDDHDAQRIAAYAGATINHLLDLRANGHGEGVAYDGYVFDFMMDWLAGEDDDALLNHPQWNSVIMQSIGLGAPGNVANVAQLGDVEPREMPFALSMLAKLYRRRQRADVAAYLTAVPLDWMRSDGLVALRDVNIGSAQWPAPGAIDAHYAAVVRTGWDADDVAVAVSKVRSELGHLHTDTGSVVIATQGTWLIDDPGYQQYLPNSERQFAIGPTAHNAPVINGQPQVSRQGEVRVLEPGRVIIDMTRCYDASLQLDEAVRSVWLVERDMVVIADRVRGERVRQLRYHWHGHPDAAWDADGAWAFVYRPPTAMHITCPGVRIEQSDIYRLKGSRGQMTLVTSVEDACCWWVFAFGPPDSRDSPEARPAVRRDGDALVVNGRRFEIDARGKPRR